MQKNIFSRAILFIATLCCASHVFATTLDQEINEIVAKRPDDAHVGIIVERLTDHKVLYARNSNQLFTPASVEKVITAAAALTYLGDNFRFSTKILGPKALHDKAVYRGDIYIKFTGDPSFKAQALQDLIYKLKGKNLQEIRGHVYIDNSAYDFVPYAPGWIWDDFSYAYGAPLNAVIINHNQFVLNLLPEGRRVRLTTNLPNGIARFDNQAIATKANTEDCPLRIYSNNYNSFHLAGCVNERYGEQHRLLAITDPVAYAKKLIAEDFKLAKIHFDGEVTVKTAPHKMQVLAIHESHTLARLAHKMLKESDNLIADTLLKKLGEVYYKRAGDWQNGVDALEDILKPTHINFKDNLINDGAGLSRYNLITPRQLLAVLRYIHNQPLVKAQIWDDFPIAGVDGTLEWRFGHKPFYNIRAKTGTMTGVSNLAGFVQSKRYGKLAFVIMFNGFVTKPKNIWRMQDEICLRLLS